MIPFDVIKNIGCNVFLGEECSVYKDSVVIGDYTYINGGKIFYAKIGRFCSIGYDVVMGSGMHKLDTITTYPMFARVCGNNGLLDFPVQKDCVVGNGVWIGNNVHIMQGVKVGDGAVIGSNAVVTHDVEPYSIVAGVPAKKIRNLHDDEVVSYLLSKKWWNWDIERIKEAISYGAFDSFEKFFEFSENNLFL